MGDFATGRVGHAIGPSDEAGEDDIKQAFRDIETFLAAKAKPMLDRLRPGAGAAALDTLRAQKLPDALLWCLALHDGGVRIWDYDLYGTTTLLESAGTLHGGARAIGKSTVEDALLCVEPNGAITSRDGSGTSTLATSFSVYLQVHTYGLTGQKANGTKC
jgi:hypothetical protein